MNDAELRFRASLDDDVSPKMEKLEQKLKRMGASPAEIKMYLRAYDEATPKISKLQQMLGKLGNIHHIQLRAHDSEAKRSVENLRREAEKPMKMTFSGLDEIKEVTNRLFSLRSFATVPGGIPGLPGIRGLGAGAGITGAIGAVGGIVQQGVQVNSEMEKSRVTLEQTLKDTNRATNEMQKLVQIAQKTPFNYSDVLAADVRLRSYQIPTMQGEGGPNNQGWLKSAGDMAAAMNTPITQAVEAIADARQGYFVRMMSYGIRMMREDFEKGGKYAGMSYEQGLQRAIQRFTGSMEMQSKTFQGVMSNLKDIFQQQVIKPLGAPAFEFARGRANQLQDKMQTPEFQAELGSRIEEVQHGMQAMLETAVRAKQYFVDYIQQPLIEIGKQVTSIAGVFASTFGKTVVEILKTVASLLVAVTKPIVHFVEQHPKLVQVYAVFKALSLLGFKNITDPFSNFTKSVNPLHFSLTGVLGSLAKMPTALAKLGGLAIFKQFVDAKEAAHGLNQQFEKMSKTDSFGRLKGDIAGVAHGLGQSYTNMQKLVAAAGAGIPGGAHKGGFLTEEERMKTSMQTAKYAAALDRDYGIDTKQGLPALLEEIKRRGAYEDENGQQQAARSIRDLKTAADVLGMTFKDMTQIIQRFAGESAKVGLAGAPGAPYIAAMLKDFRVSQTQTDMGLTSPDSTIRSMLQATGSPSIDQLIKMQGARPGTKTPFETILGNFRFRNNVQTSPNMKEDGSVDLDPGTIFEQLANQYRANSRKSRTSIEDIHKIAPHADVAEAANPWRERGMNVDWRRIREAQGQPKEQARRMMEELAENKKFLDGQNEAITDITNQINNYTNKTQLTGQAIDSLNLKMQKWQGTLVPLQRDIEDQSLAMQDYAARAIRPLERQMNRMQQASSEMSQQLNEAQYQMSKWTSGLLEGEQAALNQMHAMERYNRQLQIMQLTYQQIGADLGTTTYDEGARVRVNPMANFTLAAEQERLNRKQQLAQLKMDDTYGEQRYQLQQAARTRNERTERPFEDRIRNVRRLQPRIDDLTESQRALNREIFGKQREMFNANEIMGDMQDKLSGMQRDLAKKSQGSWIRDIQDELRDAQIEAAELQKKLVKLEQRKVATENTAEDLKYQGKTLQDTLNDQYMIGGSYRNRAQRAVDVAEKAGILDPKQADLMRKNIKEVAKELRAQEEQKVRTDQKWINIIREGVKGLGTGDTFRRAGEVIKQARIPGTNIQPPGAGTLGGIVSAMGSGPAQLALAVPAIAIASGIVSNLVRQTVIRGGANVASQILPGRAGQGARTVARWAAGGGFAETMRDQFRLSRRLRGFAAGAVGTAIAGAATGGNPIAAMAGGFFAGRKGEEYTLREWTRALTADGRARNRAASAARRAAKASDDAAKKVAETAEKQARNGSRFGRTLARFKPRLPLGRFSGIVKAFGVAGAAFGATTDTFKDAIKGFKSWGAKHLPGFLKPAKDAADKAKDAAKSGVTDDAAKAAKGAQNLVAGPRKPNPFLRGAGRVFGAAFAADTAAGIAEGDASSITLGAGGAFNAAKAIRTGAGVLQAGKQFVKFGGPATTAASFIVPEIVKQPDRASPEEIAKMRRQQNAFMMTRQAEMLPNDWRDAQKNLAEEEKIWLHANRTKQVMLSDEIKERQKHNQNIDGQLKQLDRLQRSYDSHYLQFKADSTNKMLKAHKKGLDTMNNQEDAGLSGIYDKTNKWLKKVEDRVKKVDRNINGADTSDSSGADTSTPGSGHSISPGSNAGGPAAHMAYGGKVIKGKGDGKGRLYWAGEEDDELIVPLAPHRRDRAKNLVKQAAGIVGMALGGSATRDRAYLTAKAVYERASAMSFANGGKVGAAGDSIVPIPGQPGEFINKGILPDVQKLIRKFKLRITDGFAKAGHAALSDHKWGGAIDAVPGPGGSWDLIDKLAKWAEPKQNNPIDPFRWVGYDGDSGHGRGHHIHLSWQKQFALDAGAIGAIPSTGKVEKLTIPSVPFSKKDPRVVAKALGKALRKKRREWQKGGGGDLSKFAGGGDSAANMRLGKEMAKAFGWAGGQWNALKTLWSNESGWQSGSGSDNPTSSAYGIPQALTTLHKLPGDYMTNPATQIAWGLKYIKGKYGNPASALKAWTGRSPHWYKTGAYNIGEDNHPAMLHKAEMVLPAKVANQVRGELGKNDSANAKWRKLTDLIGEIHDKIKKSEKHLAHANDREDKKKEKANLADLNADLRKAFSQRRAQENKASSSLQKSIKLMGDTSGGEDTLAGVRGEVSKFKDALAAATKSMAGSLKKDAKLVTKTTNLRKTAGSLLKTAKTPVQKRLAKTAVTLSTRAVKSAKKAQAKGKSVAKAVGRANYLKSAAKRGVSSRLVKDITGKALSTKKVVMRDSKGKAVRDSRGRARKMSESTAYKRAAKAAPGSKAATKALNDLSRTLRGGLKGQRDDLKKLRSGASKDAAKAERAVKAAARSQGKSINSLGKTVRSAGNRTAKASSSVGKHVRTEGAKARQTTDKVRGESKKGTEATKSSDARRAKAEITADKREREHYKKVEKFLESIAKQDLNVNIHNKAEGARLSTTVVKSKRRSR